MKSIRRQQGHAALVVAIVVPALWGLMSLSIDGSRAIQDKARIDDALEAATLAVAAKNDPNEDEPSDPDTGYISLGQGSKTNQTITKAYLTHYLTDLESIKSIDIEKKDCDSIPECVDGVKNGEPRYYRYTISATTKHDTWLPNNAAMGDSFEVSSSGSSIKYQSTAIDVILVSDFSGSMQDYWSGTKRKYLNIIDIIKAVTDELAIYNSYQNMDTSKVAFVGYNDSTYQFTSTGEYWQGPWWWRRFYNQKYCRQQLANFSIVSTYNIFDRSVGCVADHYVYIDDDGDFIRATPRSNYFYDLALTSDYTTFNAQISRFYPASGTASYQGLVRGARIAAQGDNPKRLIIILSDGKDNDPTKTATLVNNGLCTEITDYLDSQTTSEGKEVQSTIAVIGFDYTVSENQALEDCVGSSNIYEAKNEKEILKRILELISDEFGYLAN
ncbi:pilus assembly protein [Vibrio hannami]|uniref:TadE/TadG family type IV pilus assembly protein n=1 Tax=Vibrio hannami TaxID=2717094 RepID=UPI00240F6AD3|nr:TadE/TadG family type IV pilus assembly protein [Vibrio hannami]MDG3085984.1 pilus assembly protein [Vibrio hannami]